MANFIQLTCPACGGKLELNNTIDRFACAHCGIEHAVSRGGGIVSLQPVIDRLQRIQSGTDRTAAELALQRLRGERSELQFVEAGIKEQIKLIIGEIFELAQYSEQAKKRASKARRNAAIVFCMATLSVLAPFFSSELRAFSFFCLSGAFLFLIVGIAKIAESRDPRSKSLWVSQSRTELNQLVALEQQLEQKLSAKQMELQVAQYQIRQNDTEIGEQRRAAGLK